jgi:NADP-dependent 3-hydroxy acid dehydrogenase YdfG
MLLAPVAEAREEDWRRMVELNLLGAMVASKAALPHMKRIGGGHIVTVASVAARVANPSAAAYAATKFGIAAFCESLRREVYKDKIRVTVIEPGLVATELGEHITHPGMKASVAERAAAMTPLAAEDVAAAITYAVTQPAHVNVNEILVRPTDQER